MYGISVGRGPKGGVNVRNDDSVGWGFNIGFSDKVFIGVDVELNISRVD